ncbi:MAG: adenylate kinase [Actinomycetia bacterium]|nr:adenylate kinase [Actinomycetes bacterium]
MTTRLVIMGRQGAGKGTQCIRLASHYGIPHISTGDMLRAAVAHGTELGVQAKAIMDAGGLVNDEIMNGIVTARLAQPDAQPGFILDGYPRTAPQADFLEGILAESGGLDAAVDLEVPLPVVTERMKARGRADDTDEAIARRLELYEQETAPLLSWFTERDLLLTVPGVGTEDEVFDRLVSAIEGREAVRP